MRANRHRGRGETATTNEIPGTPDDRRSGAGPAPHDADADADAEDIALIPLPRRTIVRADGSRVHIYGRTDAVAALEVIDAADLAPADRAVGPGPHLRHDLLSDDWVAVSPARNVRPHANASDPLPALTGSPAERFGCPLCPGGPELPVDYDAAVFDNRFPSLTRRPSPVPDPADPREAPALGASEVVMYTARHVGSLATLSPAEMARVVAIWQDRTAELWADERLAYVLPFENRGIEVGATLAHPHGQLYAFDRLPPSIERRAAAAAAGRARLGGCLTCAVVTEELASERIVQRDAHWAIGVPFAPRWPYEVHLRAVRHGARRLADLRPAESRALASSLQAVVARYDALFGFELPYMLVLYDAPRGVEDWHVAAEFYPPHRSGTLTKVRASVETATGLFINDTLPEESARRLASLPVPVPATHPGFHVLQEPADG